MKARPIYGKVRKAEDIVKINRRIRQELKIATTYDAIKLLVARSRYLYTLTFSPTFKKAIKGDVKRARQIAIREYEKTVALANQILRKWHRKGKIKELKQFDPILG